MNQQTYSEGELPFWNPYQGSGAPQAANMQSAPFDPLLLAVNLHPTQRVWDFSIVGAFVLGALATFVFARVLGLFTVPAVVASAACSLSGYFFLYSNNQFSRSYVYLPIVLTFVELTLRSRRSWPVLLLGLAVTGNLVVGMPEASFFVLGAAGAYGVAAAIGQRREVPVALALARVGGGFLLGVLIASPLLLSFRQYEALSHNTHKGSSGQGSEADFSWGLLNWIAPFFHGVKKSFTSPLVRDWCGGAVAVAVALGMSGRRVTRQAHAWLFFGGTVLLLVKIYDFHVLGWIGSLPLLRQANFPLFAAPVAMFGVAILAGIGIQVLWTRDLAVRRFLAFLGAGVVVLAVVAIDDWQLVTAPKDDVIARAWGIAAVAGALVIVAALIARYVDARAGGVLRSSRDRRRALRAGPVQHLRAAFRSVREAHVDLVRRQRTARESSFTGLRSRRDTLPQHLGRAGFAGRHRGRRAVRRSLLAVHQVIRTAVHREPLQRRPVRLGGESGRSVQVEPDVRPARGARVRFPTGCRDGTGRDAEHSWQCRVLRFVGQSDGAKVYENIAAYRVRGSCTGFTGSTTKMRHFAISGDGCDQVPARVRPRSSIPEPKPSSRAPHRSGLRIRRVPATPTVSAFAKYTSNSVTLRVDAQCAGLLVLPDTYFPGWSATVNGAERRVLATDGAFRGVLVPRGASTVEFHYEPSQFSIGVVLSVLALAGFGIVVVVTVVRRHRKPTTAT